MERGRARSRSRRSSDRDAEIASGGPAIAEYWRGGMAAGVKDLTLDTTEVGTAGDLAWEEGTVRLVPTKGAPTVGRYIVVWKREDGRWKLHRDIWN